MKMVKGTTTPMRTRNVSQLAAYRVVGMTWVFNTACVRCLFVDFPCVALSVLVMRPIVRLLFGIVLDDVTLISTWLCGFMTLFLGS
jgi:hypothetical protein